MTWTIPHGHSRRGHVDQVERGVVRTTIRWPRGLALVGFTALLVSAWGGIVAFVGPTFDYNANGAPSWHWSAIHGWLYLLPGAVGVVASLAVMARARAGRLLARAGLAFLGLVLIASGAWLVVGPAAWPVLHTGGPTVFTPGSSALDTFTKLIGYNLGVGLVLAVLGGMVTKASIAEREVAAATPVDQSGTYQPAPYQAAPYQAGAVSPTIDAPIAGTTADPVDGGTAPKH